MSTTAVRPVAAVLLALTARRQDFGMSTQSTM